MTNNNSGIMDRGIVSLIAVYNDVDGLGDFVASWGKENGVVEGEAMTPEIKTRLVAEMTDYILAQGVQE